MAGHRSSGEARCLADEDRQEPGVGSLAPACHAGAQTASETDWSRIAGLYAELTALVRSPVVDLNHAVAVGMSEGAEAALAIVDRLLHEPALKSYHLLPSVRGDLLHRLGRHQEACAAFQAAVALAGNGRERELLRKRATAAAEAAAAAPPPVN